MEQKPDGRENMGDSNDWEGIVRNSQIQLCLDSVRDRRDFLKDAVSTGLSAGAIASMAGCNLTEDEDASRVRRSIASLQRSDPHGILASFQDAVGQMKSMTSGNLTWDNIAQIHGNRAWYCEHGGWLFLPWHRAYLFYFEEICRELTGNKHFAVPYWNWTQNRTLPDIFGPNWTPGASTPTGSGPTNPLHDHDTSESRTMTTTDSLSGTVATESNVRNIQKEPNFFRYAGGTSGASSRKSGPKGKNESMPHDAIHGEVGGHLWGPDSAFDPVFWTHHCMIDCLWYDWNLNRGHPNTRNSSWLNARLNTAGSDPKFVDKDGNTIDKVEVIETVLMPLAYDYEDCLPAEEPTPVADPESFLEEGADVELRVVEEFPLRQQVTVEVEEPIIVPTDIDLDQIVPFLTREKEGRFLVRLSNIDPPEYPANLRTRVFVNRPDVTPEATVDDPRFVDHIPFFVAPEEQPNFDLFVDVTETLRSLFDEDQLDEPLSFQFVSVPTGEIQTDGSYTIGRMDLAITRSIINGEVVEY